MGYRSQVAYIIAFEDDGAMGEFVTYVFGSGDEHMINALKECEVDFKDLRINYYESDVKWYDSYDDVKGHTSLYELVTVEDTPFYDRCDYRFIRLGEEDGDIQEDASFGSYDPDDGFYVVRSIEKPFNDGYEPYGSVLGKLVKEKESENI
jgi:hypothetical protein